MEALFIILEFIAECFLGIVTGRLLAVIIVKIVLNIYNRYM